jgi:predicted HTH transcriptional regulator
VRLEVLSMLEGPAPVVEEKRVSRLGEYLLRAQFITSQQLEFALAEQQKTAGSEMPRKLGEILVERGDITSQQLEQGIRDQHQDFNNLFVD